MCLGDATGLAGDHVGVADLVEQLRLAVVDVAHDRDDRRARRRRPSSSSSSRSSTPSSFWSSTSCSSPGLTRRIVGADLLGEQLDLLVAERLRGRDHLAHAA